MRNRKPVQLLAELVERALLSHVSLFNNKPKPGEMITRLPAKDRELLQELKASDTDNVRYPSWR